MSQKAPSETDRIIGARMRARRIQIGMSQEKLADELKLTFQQVQKYEKGTNRITVGRLLQIAKTLNVDIDYFFDNVSAAGASVEGLLTDKETVQLVQAFHGITSPKIRRAILELVRSTAANGGS